MRRRASTIARRLASVGCAVSTGRISRRSSRAARAASPAPPRTSATTRSSWAGRSALVRSSIAAWRRRSTSASSSGPSDSTSTWPSTLLSRRTSRRSGAGACSRSIRARSAGGLDGEVAMTAPLDQPGGGQPRAIVGGVRLWAGGAATTLVVALIALVGVPGLAGDETGTLATALLASYAVMWAGTTLLLTGGLHLLLLFVRRPLQRFAWVASALVLLAVGAPFTAVTSRAAALAAALINLVTGGVAWVLLLRVGRGAVQDSRRRFLAPPAGGNAARADASASQTGARRPRR